MALALVEGMAEDWQPTQYHDTYREDVLAMVKKKIKANQTKTITVPEEEGKKPHTAEVIDLMALLKRSIGTKGGKPDPEKPSGTTAKTGRKVAAKSIAKAKNSTSAKAPSATAKKSATLRRSRA